MPELVVSRDPGQVASGEESVGVLAAPGVGDQVAGTEGIGAPASGVVVLDHDAGAVRADPEPQARESRQGRAIPGGGWLIAVVPVGGGQQSDDAALGGAGHGVAVIEPGPDSP